MTQPSPSGVDELVEAYERVALAWDASQGDAKTANRLFIELHGLALLLRTSSEGRSAVEGLLKHDNRGVRLVAAADSLQWRSRGGVKTLTRLKESVGAHSFTADMTLREFEAGRM